jgi:hypothetical protein
MLILCDYGLMILWPKYTKRHEEIKIAMRSDEMQKK